MKKRLLVVEMFFFIASSIMASSQDLEMPNVTELEFSYEEETENLQTTYRTLKPKNHLNVVGFINGADGIGQVSLNVINTIYGDIRVQLINSRESGIDKNTQPHIAELIRNSIDLNNKKLLSKFNAKNVTLFTDTLWTPHWKEFTQLPKNNIKFAYTMVEYTEVQKEWVDKLNQFFDGVIVPDEFLVEVYRNSGVNLPIFVLPLPINIHDLLMVPQKVKANKPFVFGCSAVFCERKNHNLLIDAFNQEFGNDKDVILKLHGRYGNLAAIQKKIKELNLKNIEVTNKSLNRNEYIQFLSALDCYVFISRGEGFSITPREALATGIPCILSNNTTHKTICDSNLVYSVPSNILGKAYCEAASEFIGYDFNCTIADLRKALREVYKNYSEYVNNGKKAKEWVKRYMPINLKGRYTNLINPKKIILGKLNVITNDYIITNSSNLFKKYSAN